MHSFDGLIQLCAEFGLTSLGKAQAEILQALETSSRTSLVKALQALKLQRAVQAVGMFSIFDASLQDWLQCQDGFRSANELLERNCESALLGRFRDLQLAVNVLKHGRGRSYDALVAKADSLPFRVKLPTEDFFEEGDVAEVAALVDVDDGFVRQCAQIVAEVATAIERIAP